MVCGTVRINPDTGEYRDITERASQPLRVITRPLDEATVPSLAGDLGLFVPPTTAADRGAPLLIRRVS